MGLGVMLMLIFCSSCKNNKGDTTGKDTTTRSNEVNYYAVSHGECNDQTPAGTFCLHTVTSVTRDKGDCNRYKPGDTLCINCPDGCPQTTKFYTDDGFMLRACIVETTILDGSCKEIWPHGTCKYYVTLARDK